MRSRQKLTQGQIVRIRARTGAHSKKELPSGGTNNQVLAVNAQGGYSWVDQGTTSPENLSFTYDNGQLSAVNSVSKTISLTYNLDNTINTIADGSDTRTFGYNPDGTLSSILIS